MCVFVWYLQEVSTVQSGCRHHYDNQTTTFFFSHLSSFNACRYAYGGTADFRTDVYSAESCPKIPTHKESIELISGFDGYFTPELKTPDVEMPYEGDYTQEMYAQQMIDEYIEAGIPPERVWPQSFYWPDVYYWIENTEYGEQAVALDENYESTNEEIDAYLDELVSNNVNIVAPPMQRLVDADPDSDNLVSEVAGWRPLEPLPLHELFNM